MLTSRDESEYLEVNNIVCMIGGLSVYNNVAPDYRLKVLLVDDVGSMIYVTKVRDDLEVVDLTCGSESPLEFSKVVYSLLL